MNSAYIPVSNSNLNPKISYNGLEMHLGNPALHLSMSCSVLHLLLLFIVSSPSSIPIAPETDAAQETDDTTDDPSFAAELPGKQPP